MRGSAPFWEACGRIVANVTALAAVDPEARLLATTMDDQRRGGLGLLGEALRDQGYLREGVEPARAADVIWWLTSIVTFGHLRRRSGLNVEEVADTLASMLSPILRDPVELRP